MRGREADVSTFPAETVSINVADYVFTGVLDTFAFGAHLALGTAEVVAVIRDTDPVFTGLTGGAELVPATRAELGLTRGRQQQEATKERTRQEGATEIFPGRMGIAALSGGISPHVVSLVVG